MRSRITWRSNCSIGPRPDLGSVALLEAGVTDRLSEIAAQLLDITRMVNQRTRADGLADATGIGRDHRSPACEHLLGQGDPERLDEGFLRLARQRVRRSARHQERLLRIVHVVEEGDPVMDRRGSRERMQVGLGRTAAGDHETHLVLGARPGVRLDEVIDALRRGQPGQEEDVAVPLQTASLQSRLDLRPVEIHIGAGVDRRIGDRDALPTLRREVGAVQAVQFGGLLHDEVLGVFGDRQAVIRRQIAREQVCRGPETVLHHTVVDDVGDVGPDSLGDRGDVDRQPGLAGNVQRIVDGDRVRGQIERQGDRLDSIGEQLDKPADQTRDKAPVRHLVVTHGLRPLHGDSGAVGQDRVQRLERQPGLGQTLDRPGDDAHIGETTQQRGLGEIAGLD